jgi:polyisoprenoid-binding protein YceI
VDGGHLDRLRDDRIVRRLPGPGDAGRLRANTAVGRTSGVSGSFTLKGTSITAATFTADLTGLRSDDSRRDGQLTHRGLETSTYPTATFVLGQPVDLGSIPSDGQIVKVQATGQLTLHGQTKTVQVSLEARLSGPAIAVTGSMPIAFADYGIVAPTSFLALSVEDHGTMELQLMLKHA